MYSIWNKDEIVPLKTQYAVSFKQINGLSICQTSK